MAGQPNRCKREVKMLSEKQETVVEKRALVMEMIEVVKDPKEVLKLLNSVGADIEDPDVLDHLQFNPHVNYLDLERL